MIVGVAVGATLCLVGWWKWGAVAIVVTVGIGLVSVKFPGPSASITRAAAALGTALGRGLAWLTITPIVTLVFPTSRVLTRVWGSDPLLVRASDRRTFWADSDSDRRRVRWIRSMFATDPPAGRRRVLIPMAVTLSACIVAAELILRAMGFGTPIVYRSDDDVGYYPAPNQSVERSGGRVATNSFGMRSPEVDPAKPPRALRILLLGDSTLWGGSYVDQDEIYASRLARLLAESNSNPGSAWMSGDVEVLCVGVNGWGPFHKTGYVRKFGTFDADIAIVCLPTGDVFRNLSGLSERPFISEHARPSFALQEVGYHLMWRFREKAIGPLSQEDLDRREGRGVDAYVKLAELLQDSGCEVFAEILPSRRAGLAHPDPPQEELRVAGKLRSALGRVGVNAGFPIGLFADAAPTDRVYHDEAHLHVDGHRIYSRYLADHIMGSSSAYRHWSETRTFQGATDRGSP